MFYYRSPDPDDYDLEIEPAAVSVNDQASLANLNTILTKTIHDQVKCNKKVD